MMTKKYIIMVLFFAMQLLCYSCASVKSQIEPTTENDIIDSIVDETIYNEFISDNTVQERGHVSVIPELMSEVSIGYNNVDDSKTLYVFAQPINYINEFMQWTPINTDIKNVDEVRMLDMGYGYTIAASDIKPYYPNILSHDLGIKLQKNVYQFGVLSDDEFVVEYTGKDNFIGMHRNMLVYRGAVNGSDMYVYPSTLGTNVEVEMKQAFAKNQFQLWVEIGEGMNIVKQPGGYLTVEQTINDETNVLGVIQKPLIKDSKEICSYECAVRSVKKAEDNRYIITFAVDKTLNKAGSTIFIACEIRREKQPDNCLYSGKPNLTHAFLSNYSVIGNSAEYGVGRLMLRYSLTPFALDSSKIRSATYELYALTNENAEVELVPVLEDWCSITGNWNNQYSTGEKVFKSQMENHVWAFDITESVREWFSDKSGQLEHNGLQLKYVNEDAEGSILLSNDNSLYMNAVIINFYDD